MSAIASLSVEASLRGAPANPLAHSLLETMVLSLPRVAGGANIRTAPAGREDAGTIWAGDNRLIITGPGAGVVLNADRDAIVRTQLKTTLTLTDRHDHQSGLVHYDVVVGGGSSSITLRDVTPARGNDLAGGHRADAGGVKFDIVLSHDDNVVFSAGHGDLVQAGTDRDAIYGYAGNGADAIEGAGRRTIFADRHEGVCPTGSDGRDASHAVYSANGGQFIHGVAGRLAVEAAASPNDTIFGGSAHDQVREAQSARDVDRALTTRNQDGSTTIHFLNGQSLSPNDVRLSFDDHKHHPGSASTSPFNKIS